MNNTISRSLMKRMVLLLALIVCVFYLRHPQPAAATTCQQNCENRAGTCELNCEHSGGNVRICFEGCQAVLSACLTICNK